MTEPKRVCLIDFSSMHRINWHACENDEVSNARTKTLAMVTQAAAGYDYVGICVDRPPYKRRDIDPQYKANREKTAAALLDQARNIEEQLDADGFHIVGAEGYEADDVIARLAGHFDDGEHVVDIYSADKDLMQLVRPQCCVISTMTRQKYDLAAVKEKFGVAPDLIADWLALVGDKSDNIPGIPKCGPKTAAKWLTELGGLDAIMADPDKLPGKWAAVVKENREQLATSWRLVTLMTDAPINPEIIMTEKKRKEKPLPEPEIEDIEEPEAEPENEPDAKAITAMVQRPPVEWERSLEPRDSNGAWKLANILYEARVFSTFPNAQAILATVLVGRSHGLDAVSSLQGFHVIKGKVSPSAQLLIGLVKRHSACKFFRLVDSTDVKSTWETQREGEPEPTRMEYRIEDARTAGLLGNDNWKKRPKTMLRWRAGVELARAVYPDITAGLYCPEELEEG